MGMRRLASQVLHGNLVLQIIVGIVLGLLLAFVSPTVAASTSLLGDFLLMH